MSRYIADGILKIFHVAALASKTAPTVGELTGATELTGFVLPDGINLPLPAQQADSSDIGSSFEKRGIGTFGGDEGSLACFRDATADTAWDTLPRSTDGYLVVFRAGGSGVDGAPAASDACESWPIEVGSRVVQTPSRNQKTRFVATFSITAEPALDAVVAA